MDPEIKALSDAISEIDRKLQLNFLLEKPFLTVDELCELYGFTKSTVYKWTHKKTIPHYKKEEGKLLHFIKEEVEEWIKRGKVKTVQEIRKGIDNALKKGGKS